MYLYIKLRTSIERSENGDTSADELLPPTVTAVTASTILNFPVSGTVNGSYH
jgi:hypothetical protein